MKLILIMLLLHFFSDFTLQGLLIELKQKKWWEEMLPKYGLKDLGKYRYDYIAGITCHSLYWALITFLPLISYEVWPGIVITQAIAHGIIDDLKANRGKLNLIEDQLLHLAQIVITWLIVTYVFC